MTKPGGRTWTGSGTRCLALSARVRGAPRPSTARGQRVAEAGAVASRPRTRQWAADLEEDGRFTMACRRLKQNNSVAGRLRVAAPVERRRLANGQRVVVVGRRLGEAVVEALRGRELRRRQRDVSVLVTPKRPLAPR